MKSHRTRKGVLIILQNNPIEDDKRVLREIIALRNLGYRVSVICPSPAERKEVLDIEDVRFFRYPVPTAGNDTASYVREYLHAWFKTAVLSVKAYWDVGFSVIQACNPPDIFFPLAAFYKLLGIKFVFDQHDLSPEAYLSRFADPNPRLYRILRFFERLTYKTSDAVLVTNCSYRDIAIVRGGVSSDQIYIVRNGPFLRLPGPPAPNEVLKMGHKYLICCMGQMSQQDGVEYLLYAAEYLIKQGGRNDIYFALVGDGSSVKGLKKMAKDMGISEHVVFTGWIRDKELLCDYLATADVCVSPEPKNPLNEHSTFIKVLDYMSAGKPIVAFDLPETRISAGEAALYAEPNNAADLARQIEVLLSNKGLRDRLGNRARDRVEKSLLWEHSEPNLVKAYQELDKRDYPLSKAS